MMIFRVVIWKRDNVGVQERVHENSNIIKIVLAIRREYRIGR